MPRAARPVDFFRTWSPAMAYALGYWWADGYMRIKRNTGAHNIEIASVDRDHLRLIAEAVGEKFDYRKITAKSECYGIEFCSKEMYVEHNTGEVPGRLALCREPRPRP